jgi:hypothetical protein
VATAILFWFYGHEAVCRNRLRLLRALNPGVYGGDAAAWPATLDLDDLWTFPDTRPAKWKWRKGDVLIASWHRDRGRHLTWDRVVIVQWDLLLLEPIGRAFPELGAEVVSMSGVRPVAETEAWWPQVNGDKRAEYDDLIALARSTYGFDGDPLCALFITQVFPRAFLDAYASAPEPELGFLEYRVPTLAAALGFEVIADPRHPVWWRADPATRRVAARDRVLNGVGHVTRTPTLARELLRAGGRRAFHPYRRRFPVLLLRFVR